MTLTAQIAHRLHNPAARLRPWPPLRFQPTVFELFRPMFLEFNNARLGFLSHDLASACGGIDLRCQDQKSHCQRHGRDENDC